MSRCVPIRELTHRRLAMPENDSWIEDLGWIPVSASELHLACRYYPLAMRVEKQRQQLGLLLHSRYLMKAPLDSSGKWCGAYRPIALRCFPFEAPRITDDPLSDILIDADSKYLSPAAGITIVDEAGRPNRLFVEMHRHFGLLEQSQERFGSVLDQYLIAGLLVPLAGNNDNDLPLYVIDPARFKQLNSAALSAMARHNFLSVDVAMAWFFSMQNLRIDYLPKSVSGSRVQHFTPASSEPDPFLMDDMSLVLDDGELVSLANIDIGPAEVPPKEVAPPR
jgi:hypothetical protein